MNRVILKPPEGGPREKFPEQIPVFYFLPGTLSGVINFSEEYFRGHNFFPGILSGVISQHIMIPLSTMASFPGISTPFSKKVKKVIFITFSVTCYVTCVTALFLTPTFPRAGYSSFSNLHTIATPPSAMRPNRNFV